MAFCAPVTDFYVFIRLFLDVIILLFGLFLDLIGGRFFAFVERDGRYRAEFD